MNKRDQLLSEALRARVRELLAAGWSLSRIAKATGKTYQHIKQIAAQEARQ